MKKKIKVLLFILLGFMLVLSTKVNAAMEIKSGTTAHTSITLNNAYTNCYNMRSPSSSLGNNTLDPHLALNKDWGAVAYLGLSPYGAVNSATGPTTKVSERTYCTTNGNASGVLDFGARGNNINAYLGTYLSIYNTADATSQYPDRDVSKLRALSGTKYVETISTGTLTEEKTRGMAFAETKGWYNSQNNFRYDDAGSVARVGILGYSISGFNTGFSGGYTGGIAASDISYRPAMWN